jgi:tRNA uridine 5-carboxymethylaminomethyl modification enzyme
LQLRADNADQRLTPIGNQLGCIGPERRAAFQSKEMALTSAHSILENNTLTPTEAAKIGIEINRDGRRRNGFELLSFPAVTFAKLATVWPELTTIGPQTVAQVEIDALYASYVARQAYDVAAIQKDEAVRIPADFPYATLPSFSNEVRAKLLAQRPSTLAEAAKMDGMTPAGMLLLRAALKRREKKAPSLPEATKTPNRSAR